MIIAVPSAGRARAQVTLRSLKTAGVLPRTVLVIPLRDKTSYENNVGSIYSNLTIAALGEEWSGISKTREFILTQMVSFERQLAGERVLLMLDDDMDFCWRPDMASPRLETIKDRDRMMMLLNTMERYVRAGFVHVGLSARQGNNHESVPYKDATRMMNAYAYDVLALRDLISSSKVVLGRVPVMEDFDLTLQLLRAGYPNRVLYDYCWNQRGSGAEGGCSTYRTSTLQARAAHELARLHPDFVKVVTKNSPSQQGVMTTRTDVTVQWAKAYASAEYKHEVRA